MNTKMMMYPCSYIDPCKFMSCLRICSCLLSLFHWSKHSDLHAALLLYPIFRIRGAGMVEPAFCVATVLVNHMMNHIFAVLWPCFRKYMTQEWKQNTYPRTNTCTLTTDSDKINHFTKMVVQDIEVVVSNSKSFGDITGTPFFPISSWSSSHRVRGHHPCKTHWDVQWVQLWTPQTVAAEHGHPWLPW